MGGSRQCASAPKAELSSNPSEHTGSLPSLSSSDGPLSGEREERGERRTLGAAHRARLSTHFKRSTKR